MGLYVCNTIVQRIAGVDIEQNPIDIKGVIAVTSLIQ